MVEMGEGKHVRFDPILQMCHHGNQPKVLILTRFREFLCRFKAMCHIPTFPHGTGLGWDRIHPKALILTRFREFLCKFENFAQDVGG
mgnify:CR=1 FL=1